MGALLVCFINLFFLGLPCGSPGGTGRNFNIRLVNTGPPVSSRFTSLLRQAVDKWESVVVGELGDVANIDFDLFRGSLSQTSTQLGITFVDDVVIGYEFRNDISDNVLGFGGARFIRDDLSTISGIMAFNANLFDDRSDTDNLATMTHEIGHVLGIGTLWSRSFANCDNDCERNGLGANYGCRQAQAAYTRLRRDTVEDFGFPTLRLSNDGGTGSQCSHWENDNFDARNWVEIMARNVFGRARLLTSVTLGSLRDISRSYVTNEAAADPIPDAPDTQVTWGIPASDAERDVEAEFILLEPEFLSEFLRNRDMDHQLRH